MKRIISFFILALALISLAGCGGNGTNYKALINSAPIHKYSIVYSENDTDYSKRAAEYIRDEIEKRTDVKLPIVKDSKEQTKYEIVVGETSRDISKALNAETEGLEFAILASEKSIALEGDYFIIAAAAYYFVDTYITGDNFNSIVPEEAMVYEPITKEAKNYIVMIGDGMGENHTRLYDYMQIPDNKNYSDNESIFYGYLLSNSGYVKTDSLSGLTDSAAAGTALASGYKTLNKHIGKDSELNDLKLITELASEMGLSAAVMSTEGQTGATPSAFTAHAENRESSSLIRQSQNEHIQKYGTIIKCNHDFYSESGIEELENSVLSVLDTIDDNENGFFMMYEEAHIDKHSHNNDADKTFLALVRFNQVIARVMEYAFYNPETFVLITADHETGGLHFSQEGVPEYNTDVHTNVDVPVFVYGKGSEIFDAKTIDNTQIPKTIAKMMGQESFGDPSTAGYLE